MQKRTKIVATVGPASRKADILEELIRTGVNVFRLNFSHGDHTSHLETIKKIKEIRQKLKCPITILQDLTGPKIRLGKIQDEPFKVTVGDTLILDGKLRGAGKGNHLGVNHENFAEDVKVGSRLLLADGELEIKVENVDGTRVYCKVIQGGELYSHKGVNYPSGTFKIPALTEKDKEDLRFGLQHGVDMVAMSFVRTATDLDKVRTIFSEEGRAVPLIAKIEKHEAIENLTEIIDSADGIMVARGDLGVEINIERIPIVQKKMIRMANQAGKPVITATQMLRSMVDSPKPTRAEVTDVANAIMDGTDAIMLSEETAIGKYPVKVVTTMVTIAREAEAYSPNYDDYNTNLSDFKDTALTESVAHSAVILSRDLEAKIIFAITRSGYTAKALAKFKPRSVILAMTPNENVYHQLSIVWGVLPVMYPLQRDMENLLKDSFRIAREFDLVKTGDQYVFTSGFPLGEPGSINQVTAGAIPEE